MKGKSGLDKARNGIRLSINQDWTGCRVNQVWTRV